MDNPYGSELRLEDIGNGITYIKPRSPNKLLFMSSEINGVTQMLDRLKLPSATAGGPGDCCILVRYTAVWPYDFIS